MLICAWSSLSHAFLSILWQDEHWAWPQTNSCWLQLGIWAGGGNETHYKETGVESARLCHCGSSPPKEKKEIMMLEHFNLSFSELDRLGLRHLPEQKQAAARLIGWVQSLKVIFSCHMHINYCGSSCDQLYISLVRLLLCLGSYEGLQEPCPVLPKQHPT